MDNATFRLVREGVIKRLARGVFVQPTANFVYPPAIEIARIKARAFNKDLRIHGRDTAAKFQLQPTGNKEPTYYVDGSTSRFRYRKTYINLKKCSKKTMCRPDDNAGLAIRALWSLGEDNVEIKEINQVAALWNVRKEKEKIYRGKAWMTAWLGDFFLTDQYLGPSFKSRTV